MLSLLASCASQPVAVDQLWQLRGRLGLKTADEAASFNVFWRQNIESFDIHLSTSLGLSVAHIYGDPRHAVVELPKQGKFEAGSASELLAQHTGIDIPIESLVYWVRGEPAPGITFDRAKNEDSDVLQQLGWRIEYLKYENLLPKRIRFSRPDLRITLVVQSW